MTHSFLHQQVRRTIRRHGLLPSGARVVIGLSGGSDSVALTRVLLDLARHGEFQVVGLAHFNHQLRPTASRDETFCRELAGRLPRGRVHSGRSLSVGQRHCTLAMRKL